MNLTTLKMACAEKCGHASYTNKIIAFSAVLLAAQPLFAQKGLDIGLKCNIQTSTLINKTDQAAGPEIDYKLKTTAAFGFGVGYSFDEHMGAEIGLLFSKQGVGYKGLVNRIAAPPVADMSLTFKNLATWNGMTNFNGTYTAQTELSCMKIPILFRYTGNNTRKLYFSSFIGPQINMLSSATFKVNGQTAIAPAMSTISAFKKMTIDAVLGVGANMNITKNIGASVQLRLDYGLGDAENKSATYNAGAGSTKFYETGRGPSHNATGGGLISIIYKFVKKEKQPVKKVNGKAPVKGKAPMKPAPKRR